MKKISISFLIFVLFQSTSSMSFAKDQDHCGDILRDGIRDELASSSSSSHQLAKHNQFCSIAKKNSLNKDNFHKFAHDYAKQVKASKNSMDTGAAVGYGPFAFKGDFKNSGESSSLSEHDRVDLLTHNSESVLNYYESNCSNSSYEETLQKEAHAISRIANADLIEAWKLCMVKSHGMFVYLIGDDEKDSFSIEVAWHTVENSKIVDLKLRWNGNNLQTPYATNVSCDFRTTENICLVDGEIFGNGDLTIPISRKSNAEDEIVYVHAKTSSGLTKSASIVIPKFQKIEPLVIKDSMHPEFSIENYCSNPECPDHGKKISEQSNAGEYLFTNHQINSYVCPQCGKAMRTNYKFKNCFYKISGKNRNKEIIRYDWMLAPKIAHVFSPNSDQTKLDWWEKLKILVRDSDFTPEKEDF